MARPMAIFDLIPALPRKAKQAVIVAVDVCLVPLALIAAVALQYNEVPSLARLAGYGAIIPLLMLVAWLMEVALGVHRVQLKAYEARSMRLSLAHSTAIAAAAAVLDDLARLGTPFAAFILLGLIHFGLAVLMRFVLLQVLLAIYRRGQEQTRVLIYGAGRTGQQLAMALATDPSVVPVAFVDDDRAVQSTLVAGLRVYSALMIPTLVKSKTVNRIVLAMPGTPRTQLAQISRKLENQGLEVHSLPSFAQLAGSGARLVEQLAPVLPHRFLGRAALDDELPGVTNGYKGATILVSGAGGSIGSELCRRVLTCRPKRLVMVEMSELALYEISRELGKLSGDDAVEIVSILGSVDDAALMRDTMARFGVEIVLHAAAYKHVPIVEENPLSGFANNVLGTQVLAQVAAEQGVRRFILVSTDKAVRPKNMMGASKRLAELVIQDLASRTNAAGGGTIFSMVRFGNVVGSSGSVIPLFHEQIAAGGPVTVTHPEVTRYFMTIPEAARLVLVAGMFAEGGEVYVLNMGEPVAIRDLALQMIEAAGKTLRDEANPNGEIAIEYTGLRPGEKLHEELLIGEGQITTAHSRIMLARESKLSEIEVAAALKALREAVAQADRAALHAIVGRYVEGGAAIVAQRDPAKV